MSERAPYQRVNWHAQHREGSTKGGKIADAVVGAMGSWKFIIIQTVIVLLWMVLNVLAFVTHWDIYPFILLNLVFSTQAAYASPLILMSANRAAQRDKHQADAQFRDTEETHEIAKQLHQLIELNNQLTREVHRVIVKAEQTA
jgi:uncharacterized membrane protein